MSFITPSDRDYRRAKRIKQGHSRMARCTTRSPNGSARNYGISPLAVFVDTIGRGPGQGGQYAAAERLAALTGVLREFIDNPVLTAQDLQDRSAGLTITARDVAGVLQELAPELVPRLL